MSQISKLHTARQLADEHEHEPLFADAAEDYLHTKKILERRAGSLRLRWRALKRLFAGVRVADVDDRLLTAAERYRLRTFVQNVLRFARQQKQDRKPKRLPSRATFPTSAELRGAWVNWMDKTIGPTGFVTMLMPHGAAEEEGHYLKQPRDPLLYIRLVTKRAESILWGRSARHVRNQAERCLWIGTHELGIEPDPAGTVTGTFLHFHFLLRVPNRPMRAEKKTGILPNDDRLVRVQDALLRAIWMTSEACATGSQRDGLRVENDVALADIQVKPYGTHHAKYVFGKLERGGMLTDLNPNTLVAAGLVILPNSLRLLDTVVAHQKKS